MLVNSTVSKTSHRPSKYGRWDIVLMVRVQKSVWAILGEFVVQLGRRWAPKQSIVWKSMVICDYGFCNMKGKVHNFATWIKSVQMDNALKM